MKKIHVAFIALLVLTACATEDAAKKPADVLYAEAQKLGKGSRPDRAIDVYQNIRTYYPGHELAKRALLDMADLQFTQKQYDQAASNYNEFRMLYPTDPEAPYCLYRIGLCFFNQTETYDRDQSKSVQAVQVLGQFVSLYPTSPYVAEAKNDIDSARSLIARQELSVAEFYIRNKKYKAACARLTAVETNYGDLGFEEQLAKLKSQSCGKTDPDYVPTLYGRLRTFAVEHPLPWKKNQVPAAAQTEQTTNVKATQAEGPSFFKRFKTYLVDHALPWMKNPGEEEHPSAQPADTESSASPNYEPKVETQQSPAATNTQPAEAQPAPAN